METEAFLHNRLIESKPIIFYGNTCLANWQTVRFSYSKMTPYSPFFSTENKLPLMFIGVKWCQSCSKAFCILQYWLSDQEFWARYAITVKPYWIRHSSEEHLSVGAVRIINFIMSIASDLTCNDDYDLEISIFPIRT